MKEKKIKKPEARQNAKLEDKQLDQVQGGAGMRAADFAKLQGHSLAIKSARSKVTQCC